VKIYRMDRYKILAQRLLELSPAFLRQRLLMKSPKPSGCAVQTIAARLSVRKSEYGSAFDPIRVDRGG
jgi:hypothetical protein